MSRVERSRREKVTRYSVRKVSFGAASVAVAAFFMFLGNGAVYAAEPNVTATDSALAATPANNQLDENSGVSDSTAPKGQADTTTPAPADASSTSVESSTVSKAQADTTTSKPADATPAPAVSSTTSATEETAEKATPALDKKQLEDYVAEIDAKLASDSYATKTDESVATLKEHLGLAKLALTTAKSQDELTKAYRRLFMTVNSGLRSKPKAQVESPKLDTTEGKATVGKKASNTEKATGTNSIANSGKHDPRNGQALDANNPFRTDGTTTDTDLAANQVYTGLDGSDNETVEELSNKLKNLAGSIENNDKISKQMDSLGEATGVEKGAVTNITEFGGWTAITDSEGNGKFAIARKTDKGVFPLETINTVRNLNNGKSYTYLREQAIDRTANYMLYLSEVRTLASRNEKTFNGSNYQGDGLGRGIAYGLKGYNGIQKTFKAYSPDSGSKVKITFKTGYSGDIDGTKAKYKVQVFTSASSTKPVYDVTFDPQNNTKNQDMTVLKASDGSSVTKEFIEKPWTGTLDKQGIENQMAQVGYTPNGVAGRFTSREIELPAGVTDYTVKISSADNDHLGMGYQSSHRHFALPISGLDFHVTQDTGEVAKELLKKIYLKLKETEEKDKSFKTTESQKSYEAELQKIDQLLKETTKSTTEYKNALTDILIKKQELANSSQEASIKSNATDEIDKAVATKIQAIEGNAKLSESDKSKAKDAVTAAANAAKVAILVAQNSAEVTEKETAGKQAISNVAEIGKEQAKSEIDKAVATKLQAIEGNAKLSEADKAKAKLAVKDAADAAKSEIEQATDQATVEEKETAGKQAISNVAEIGKEQAKSEIDKAAAAKVQAIEGNAKLSEAEKSAAKAAAKKAAEDAKKAIDASTSQAEVDANVTKGTDSISSVAEVGKDQAKSALDSALSAKETAIDNNVKLSDTEKSAAKAAAKQAADDAKKAIDAATTQAEVDRVLRNDIYKDDAAINEVEAFDLSSLLVNGFVSVKQGETLTDQEVLSKVNLPKDVEVIKVEKPTTSALGRLVAKVTLKLSDGSVEEINVPVEVVAPQNHGNEGNGANNGATNTDAKADKAKLEAAIHQLDEFKFDTETAKEANALSADAKKVFANAAASQAEVDAMVKRIEDFMTKVASSTDHATPANDQAAQTPAVAPATTQAAANASQTVSAQANARKAAKELPNTGTVNSTVAMVAAAASAVLGLGLAGRRRKEDEEA